MIIDSMFINYGVIDDLLVDYLVQCIFSALK